MSLARATRDVWQRLHGALMPDYNHAATAYWWSVVGLGAAVLAGQAGPLAGRGPWAWLQIAAAAGFAVGVGLFPVRVPGTRQSFVAGDIFIFLLLLMQGPAAAALAAAVEGFVGSWRTSKRATSWLISAAVAALSVTLAGQLPGELAQALGQAAGGAGVAGLDQPAVLVGAMLLFAAAHALLSLQLIVGVPRLKRSEPFFQWAALVRDFRWVALAYLGSAVVASLLYLSYRQSGIGVLLVVLPVMVLLIVALHYYFLQQEAAVAMQGVAARAAEEAERHVAELQASEQRFDGAFTHAAIGMALLDHDGRLLQANHALRGLLGLAADGALPARFQDVVDPADQAALSGRLPGAAADSAGFTGFQLELRCRRSDGEPVWVLAHCGQFTEPQAGRPCLILQLQDISARRQAEAGLHRLAFHDSLTGLPNRRQFLDSLADAVARHQADAGASYAVMYLDFDRFKLVNDSLGHNAGDQLLVQMARRVQENLRPSDIVARLGGDEFAVLLPRLRDERDALQLAERLVEAMRRPFDVAGQALHAGASIGITFSRFGYTSPDAVVRDADTAMYQAKSLGKGRYALFEPGLHAAVAQRLQLEADLRRALDDGALTLAFQPQVELATGRAEGFEALVRWQHPQQGAIRPEAIIPLAEETGLITLLSDFVLHSACAQLARWHRADPAWAELTMSVNLSGHDIASRGVVARVSEALASAGVAPRHLVLELTEDAVMTRIDAATANLRALRALGVHLSVDDFGTGHSSLARLARLPIDSVKIDRSFVRDLADGNDEATVVQAVVQAVVTLGGALGKQVVAEGIETNDQADQLRRMGCGFGQGFHLGRPLSAAEATAWLRAQTAAGAPPAALH